MTRCRCESCRRSRCSRDDRDDRERCTRTEHKTCHKYEACQRPCCYTSSHQLQPWTDADDHNDRCKRIDVKNDHIVVIHFH